MTASLSPVLVQRFFDENGAPLAGGLLYSYVAGTTTLQATYTDATQSTPNTNPVVLDADGYADVWLGFDTAYRFELHDASNTLIWTVDNVVDYYTLQSQLLALLSSTADPGEGAGLIGFNPALAYDSGTVGGSLLERIFVNDLIPAGTDTSNTDVSSYILEALTLGRHVTFQAGQTYYLGTRNSGQVVFNLANTGQIIEGNGATLKVQTTDSSNPVVFQAADLGDLEIRNINLLDSAAGSLGSTWSRAILLRLRSISSATTTHATLVGCQATNAGALLVVDQSTPGTGGWEFIRLKRCRAVGCWYGLRFYLAGTDVAGDFRAENCVCPYLVDGVRGHALRLSIEGRQDLGLNKLGPVQIQRTGATSTADINLELWLSGTFAYSYAGSNLANAIVLFLQDDTTSHGYIYDVSVGLYPDMATFSMVGPGTSYLLALAAFSSGTLSTSTTSTWDNLAFSGSLGSQNETGVGPTESQLSGMPHAFTITSPDTGLPRISFSPSIGSYLKGYDNSATGFLVKESPWVETYVNQSNPTTATFNIPIPSIFQGGGGFGLWLDFYGTSDIFNVATGNQFIARAYVIGHFIGGVVTVDTSAYTEQHTVGTAPSAYPTIGAAGNTLAIGALTGSAYNSSGGQVSVRVTRLSLPY